LKTPDPADLIEQLTAQGASIRLRRSGQVHTLDLSKMECEVTDTFLDRLSVLQSLEVLDLQNSKISDAVVDILLTHSRLKLLTLTGTQISAGSIKRLRQNLIGCRIIA